MKQMDEDTRDFLEYAKTNDPGLFRKIYEKYKNKILGFIMYTGNLQKTDAEDVLQGVFFKAIEHRRKFKPKAKFSTWLHTMAYNRTLNFLRDQKPCQDIDNTVLVSPEKDPLEKAAAQDEKNRIIHALNQLSDQQKRAIVLREYSDKSYREIASIMGVSESAVESLIFHARQNLKKHLKGYMNG
jgi:RNA polymerase sigma-70 factor (ECF subfamily)